MAVYVYVILFFVMLAFAALFAFLETAFTALRLFKLRELEISVAKYKKLFDSWEKNPQRILITILIANNFAHVMASVLITEIMQHFLGSVGLAVGVALATLMILVFGEIIPKSFAKTHHEKLFASFLWLINILYHLFYPIVTILLKIAETIFVRLGGKNILEKQDIVSEKEIEFLIDYSDEKGLMETEKTEMLQNIFSLGQTLVKEIMIPKADIVLVSVDDPIEKVLEAVHKSGYSRLPVYEGDDENVIGIIYQKDVFDMTYRSERKGLRELLRPVLFVPETQKTNQLLSEFLKKRMHLAIIIDEYGSCSGLATLEDVIEEIVGDISDEHESVDKGIIALERGGWLIDGRTNLDDVEELLNVTFKVKDSLTISGFLSEELQHIPKKGERIFYQGYCFQVQQANTRRVFQVLVFKESESSGHPQESEH